MSHDFETTLTDNLQTVVPFETLDYVASRDARSVCVDVRRTVYRGSAQLKILMRRPKHNGSFVLAKVATDKVVAVIQCVRVYCGRVVHTRSIRVTSRTIGVGGHRVGDICKQKILDQFWWPRVRNGRGCTAIIIAPPSFPFSSCGCQGRPPSF